MSGEIRVAVLTVSDLASRGQREDVSGDLIAQWAEERDFRVVARSVVPDRTEKISAVLVGWADGGTTDVILTTGGTGLTERDVTPEATAAILEKEAPGVEEAVRRTGQPNTPFAILSRGRAGSRGQAFIVNLPGSPGGVRDGLSVLDPIIEHAVELLRGEETDHQLPDA